MEHGLGLDSLRMVQHHTTALSGQVSDREDLNSFHE